MKTRLSFDLERLSRQLGRSCLGLAMEPVAAGNKPKRLDSQHQPAQSGMVMAEVKHRTRVEMEAGLATIRQSPKDVGVLKLIVRRPQTETREISDEGLLDPAHGLVGDNWQARGSNGTPDKSANPEMQLTLMNARVIELLSPDPARWALAGDQLFVDLDLSESNVPPGTRLALGTAVIEVTAPPHLGCQKFSARYGVDAVKFVNSPTGRELHLRGVNAKVVQPGVIRVGDLVKKR